MRTCALAQVEGILNTDMVCHKPLLESVAKRLAGGSGSDPRLESRRPSADSAGGVQFPRPDSIEDRQLMVRARSLPSWRSRRAAPRSSEIQIRPAQCLYFAIHDDTGTTSADT